LLSQSNPFHQKCGRATKCPYSSDKISPGVRTAESPTTNREQETVRQETDVVVDVAQDLEHFGIAQSAVARLIQRYPAAYIREKLEMAKGLVAAGSCLVSQNPAGWLRKAIEEDYTLPKTPERHRLKDTGSAQEGKRSMQSLPKQSPESSTRLRKNPSQHEM
jgi:hypothetical protein